MAGLAYVLTLAGNGGTLPRGLLTPPPTPPGAGHGSLLALQPHLRGLAANLLLPSLFCLFRPFSGLGFRRPSGGPLGPTRESYQLPRNTLSPIASLCLTLEWFFPKHGCNAVIAAGVWMVGPPRAAIWPCLVGWWQRQSHA